MLGVDKKPPKFNVETQFCAWSGDKWIVSEIQPPPKLEAPPIPDPPALPEQKEDEHTHEEPEPYVETYADKRAKEYGTTDRQIEFITENGLEAWQARVAEIKKKYPKE